MSGTKTVFSYSTFRFIVYPQTLWTWSRQSRQSVMRFSGDDVPPCLRYLIWCRVSLLCVDPLVPQCWHWWLSLERTMSLTAWEILRLPRCVGRSLSLLPSARFLLRRLRFRITPPFRKVVVVYQPPPPLSLFFNPHRLHLPSLEGQPEAS